MVLETRISSGRSVNGPCVSKQVSIIPIKGSNGMNESGVTLVIAGAFLFWKADVLFQIGINSLSFLNYIFTPLY